MRTMQDVRSITDAMNDWARVLRESAQLGADLLRSIMPAPPRPSTHPCSCEIPPACWLPVKAGDVESSACSGATATIRIRVTNCGATSRDVTLEVAGSPKEVTISPATLHLEPMQHASSTISLPIADTADEGQRFEHLVWVRGCKSHFLRWTVRVGEGGGHCPTASVEDCPDTVHHWYDHFYCHHPCQGH